MVFPSVLPHWLVVTLLLTVGTALLLAFAYLLLRIGDALVSRSVGWLLRLPAVLLMALVISVALYSLWSVLGKLDDPVAIITTVIAYVGGVVLVLNWFGGIFAPTVRQGHFDQAMDDQTKTITDAMDDQTKTIVDAMDGQTKTIVDAMDGQTKTIADAMDGQTKTIVDAIDRLAEVGRERDERMLSVLSEVLEELRVRRTGNDVGDAA